MAPIHREPMEGDVQNGKKRVRALGPVFALAAVGAAMGGCGLPDGYYGGRDHYGSPGYYGSPSYYRSHRHNDGHRSSPRTENWSQQRLQQHWLNQARQAR